MVNRVFSIATSGMEVQRARMSASASNIANLSTPEYQPVRAQITANEQGGGYGATADIVPAPGEGVSIIREMVTQSTAIHAYRANAAVIRSTDEMLRSALDIRS